MGSLALVAATTLNLSWHGLFTAMAVLSLTLVVITWRFSFPTPTERSEQPTGLGIGSSLRNGIRDTLLALRRPEIIRWLILLAFSDMMLDVLHGFIALYFVDVVGASKAQAAMAVVVWIAVGLLGDLMLIPLLERVRGLIYLRFSAAILLFIFPAFLLLPDVSAKLILLGLLGIFNSGWYSILKAQLYSNMPGQSGMVMTVGSLFCLINGLIPLGIGLIAEHYGLSTSMWLLILGPIALLIGIPKRRKRNLTTKGTKILKP
jgi:FSR family fosmidomycin resistance protein-like MFS transporter